LDFRQQGRFVDATESRVQWEGMSTVRFGLAAGCCFGFNPSRPLVVLLPPNGLDFAVETRGDPCADLPVSTKPASNPPTAGKEGDVGNGETNPATADFPRDGVLLVGGLPLLALSA
jgi:hypothetical protein